MQSMDVTEHKKSGFDIFGLDANVAKGVVGAGYTVPTEVQEEVIPLLMNLNNVLVQSKTGTGKTASFAIPILHRLRTGIGPHLVLAPTRELAEQVAGEFQRLGFYSRVRVVTLIGGLSINPQFDSLRRGYDVIVGTPGRILDHVSRGSLKLEHFKTVIVDEADRMLDMGFIDDVDRILRGARSFDLIGLFSATIPPEVERLANRYAVDFRTVRLGADEFNVETISHFALDVGSDAAKERELERILREERASKTLIFTATKRRSERLGRALSAKGYRVGWMNGDLSQAQRNKVLSMFRKGHISMLVATDVAARGLDVNGIERVINYDIPMEPLTYVHRIGRTGRMGKTGKAFSLVSPRDRQAFSDIEVKLNRKIPSLR